MPFITYQRKTPSGKTITVRRRVSGVTAAKKAAAKKAPAKKAPLKKTAAKSRFKPGRKTGRKKPGRNLAARKASLAKIDAAIKSGKGLSLTGRQMMAAMKRAKAAGLKVSAGPNGSAIIKLKDGRTLKITNKSKDGSKPTPRKKPAGRKPARKAPAAKK